MNQSFRIFIRKSYRRQDQKAAVYLRVYINTSQKDIPLQVYWYPEHFEERCLAVPGEEKQAYDNNLIISDSLAKANEVLIQYRLRRKAITIDQFVNDFHQGLPSEDFFTFFEMKMKQRLQERDISIATFKANQITLNHLKRWKKKLYFDQLDERSAYQFESWMQKKTDAKSINGRWGHHKNFKVYLNLAKREKIDFINPYDYFTAKNQMGRFQPLEREHFMRLYHAYQAGIFRDSERECLRAFLFACLTGMRHGDVRRVEMDWLDGEFFDFVPMKTKRFGTRVRVPACREAQNLIADEMDEVNRSPMFSRISEQKQNEAINNIAKCLDIPMRLCFQIARETFATLYMEQNGKLEVLASFLGHTSTKMSEKYVKIRDQRKKEEGERISNFMKKENPAI
jgi:integrase/recombinase XerD